MEIDSLFIYVKNPPKQSDKPYNPGSGFFIYVDGARFLPQNVTVSRVTTRFFDCDFVQTDDPLVIYQLFNSDIYFPVYRVRWIKNNRITFIRVLENCL